MLGVLVCICVQHVSPTSLGQKQIPAVLGNQQSGLLQLQGSAHSSYRIKHLDSQWLGSPLDKLLPKERFAYAFFPRVHDGPLHRGDKASLYA